MLLLLTRHVSAGGYPLTSVVAFFLFTGEQLLRHRGKALAMAAPTSGVEGKGKEEEEECIQVSSGNRLAGVNPPGYEVTKITSVAAAEAGHLRRRASALLQNKVFDSGGNR